MFGQAHTRSPGPGAGKKDAGLPRDEIEELAEPVINT